jgi:ketosteroid isomerase-like protein
MKRMVLAVVGFALTAGTSSSAGAQTSERDAVITVIEAFAAFSQAKNISAIDTLFASDRGVHIIEGAGVNHGWVDYRDNHLQPELEGFENFRYRYYAVEPQVRQDVAWNSFRYELAADTPRGHVELEGRGTAVLEKREGRWVIVHLHTSGRRRRDGQ